MARMFLVMGTTGKEYEIVGRDEVAGTITLKGSFAQFDEPYNVKRFKELGYKLVTREDTDDEPASPEKQAPTLEEDEDADEPLAEEDDEPYPDVEDDD